MNEIPDDMPSVGDIITDAVMAAYARGWREGREAAAEERKAEEALGDELSHDPFPFLDSEEAHG